MVPLNTTKWNTSVASWSDYWSWSAENVKVVAQLPTAGPLPTDSDVTTASTTASEVSDATSDGTVVSRATGQPRLDGEGGDIPAFSGFAALTMTYEKHQRNGRTVYYKSGIMKSTLPAGVTYGRAEARIKGASRWPGVCPAFWAWRHTPEHWTELDFVEMGENAESSRDIDFTSHVMPPTPGVLNHVRPSSLLAPRP